MPNRDQLSPAIAAVSLAILFPLYWLFQLNSDQSSIEEVILKNITTLDLSDLLFLILGGLEVFVFLNLRRFFKERYNQRSFDVPIYIFIFSSIVFYFIGIGFDLICALTQSTPESLIESQWANVFIYAQYLSLILYGIANILIAAILIKYFSKIGMSLKVYAVVALIMGLGEISIVFAPVSILLFPVALIALALFFLETPAELEII